MESITAKSDMLSDPELIEGILAGEKRLFEQIIRRYNQRLFRTGMAILNDDTETEDAMQVTYIKAYEHLHTFGNLAAFSTWITRIMINECLARKKKMARFSNEPEKHIENRKVMNTPIHIMVNKELSNVLEKTVAQLPEKYRLVFVLREIEELSVRETGQALGIDENNVKVRLNRAKTMLRDRLDDYMKDNVYAFHLTRCDRIVERVMTHLGIS